MKYYAVIQKPNSYMPTRKRDFDDMSKDEIIDWCKQRGYDYAPEKENSGTLKTYEFYVTTDDLEVNKDIIEKNKNKSILKSNKDLLGEPKSDWFNTLPQLIDILTAKYSQQPDKWIKSQAIEKIKSHIDASMSSYYNVINAGHISVKDVIAIIKSAGLTVPKNILELNESKIHKLIKQAIKEESFEFDEAKQSKPTKEYTEQDYNNDIAYLKSKGFAPKLIETLLAYIGSVAGLNKLIKKSDIAIKQLIKYPGISNTLAQKIIDKLK